VLKDLVSVDSLKAQGALGTSQFITEAVRQAAPLQDKINSTTTQLTDTLKQTGTTTATPGAPVTKPTQATVDQSTKEVGDRQKLIDQTKSGLDGIANALKYVDPTLGGKVLTYVDTIYKLATEANKLISAAETIGADTGVGATFGGIGAVVGAAVGIVQVLMGCSGPAAPIGPPSRA
jgi:hypothetical protein